MKNQPDTPVATSYLKTYEGGKGYDETPLAFVTVTVDSAKAVCISAALLRAMLQDLQENDFLPNVQDQPRGK